MHEERKSTITHARAARVRPDNAGGGSLANWRSSVSLTRGLTGEEPGSLLRDMRWEKNDCFVCTPLSTTGNFGEKRTLRLVPVGSLAIIERARSVYNYDDATSA